MINIADRIGKLIEVEGLNPHSFSQKIGTSDTVIRNILIRRNQPGFEVINKIIKTFDWINAKWLITGSGSIREDGSSHVYIEDRIRELEDRMAKLESKTGENKNEGGRMTGYDAPVPKNPLTKKVDTPLVRTTRKKI